MKKIFSWAILCLFSMVAVHGQKLSVPDAVLKAFKAKFPAAKQLKWNKENAKEYEAEFMLDNNKTSANFDPDGRWKETETIIPVTELPNAVTNAIMTRFKDALITEADRIEKPGARTVYEADIKLAGKKKEVLLKEDGTFMK